MQRSRLIIATVLAAMLCVGSRAQGIPSEQSTRVIAQPEPVRVAIDHLRNLEYEPAKLGLEAWLKEHPEALCAWNYLAIATLYEEMFRQGVLESKVYGEGGEVFKPSKVPVTPEFQKELFAVLDKAQTLADERLKKDPKDEEAMYWAGVTHGTRATYHFTLRKEYTPALREATAAYKQHKQLLKLDPGYVDAYLIVGVNNYVVGSLPWYLKMMASLTGRHGNRAEGLRQIERVTREGHYAREDAQLVLAVLYQREKMFAEALPLYQHMATAYSRNYLLAQEVGTLYGLVGDWTNAAREYDTILAKYQAGQPNFDKMPAAPMFFLAGQAHDRQGDSERALVLYNQAAQAPGDNKYRYKADLAAAELEARMNRTANAREHYQRIAEAAPDTEEGKLAKKALKRLPPP